MSDLVNLGFKADTGGLTRAQMELDKTTVAGGRLDKQNSITTRSLGLVGAAIAAVGVAASAQQIIKYTDSWSNLNTQLRQVTSSEEQLLVVREQLLQVSRETRIDLDATVGLYAEMTRGTSDLGLSSDKLVEITKTLNNLFLAGGKPLSEMTGAIRQLNQGFASGVLRGDEFNSVAEGAPRIMDALTASLGKTRGELREFAATGGITSQVMVEALESYSGNAQRLADTVKLTFEQTMGLVQTNVTQFVGESEVISSTVDALGGSLLSLSENIESVGYALGAAAGVIGVSMLPAMGKYVLSVGAAAYANVTAAPAVTGMTAALGGQAKALTSGAIAANVFGTAWRFALGPVGLLVTALGAAAVAFNIVSESIEDANAKAEKHAKAMSELETIYSKWSKTRLEDERNKLLARSNEILFERLEITEKLEAAQAKEAASNQRNGDPRSKATNIYSAEVKELQERLAALNDENANVDNGIGKVIKALDAFIVKKVESNDVINNSVDANKKLADSFNSQVLALQNQQMQLSMTADEFEIYGAIQNAVAYNATVPMTEAIIAQVKALQSQRNAIAATNLELEGMMGGDLFGFGDSGDEVDKFGDDLKSITDDIDNFGGAWSSTGNIVVDAFGDMTDAMNDYADRMESIGKIQTKIDAAIIDAGDDKEKLSKLAVEQTKLDKEKVSAELDGYRAVASGAADMFSEKTAAAKAFNAIEQAIAAAQLAMSLQNMLSSTVETGVVVANETTKQGALGTTAVLNQGAGDPYTAFARMAAMAALVASLTSSFSGGGSSYEALAPGGTGTILGAGDEQSESITNAFDTLEDIEIDQLAELQGIRQSMNSLSSGIEKLAKSFVSDLEFGDSGLSLENSNFLDTSLGSIARKVDPIGLMADLFDSLTGDLFGLGGIVDSIFGSFSSTKQKLVDSGVRFVSQTYAEIFESGQVDASVFQVIEKTKKKFWGLSKSSSTNTELTGVDSEIATQIANVFGYIGDTVIEATNTLLGDTFTEQMLQGFQIDIGDISFKDKTGDEIQAELEAIFSQQADLMTNYVFPQLQDYQDMGEGLFETLIRVNQEQAIFNDAMERTGYEYSKFVSNLEKIDFAQSIIDLTGGIEQFSGLSGSFFESFYSDAEQLAYLESSLSEAFDDLGFSMVDSREGFKDLINGIDITTEAGQQLYAMMLQLVPGMDEYLSALEDEQEAKDAAAAKLKEQSQSLDIQLLEAQGETTAALALSRQLELEAADESLHGIMNLIYAYQDHATALAEEQKIIDEKASLSIRLLEAQGRSEEALNVQRWAEINATDESNREMLKRIYSLEDEAKAMAAGQAQVAEGNALLIRKNQALGDSEAALAIQRRLELEAVDGVWYSLLQEIHALEDLAKAKEEREQAEAAAEVLADARSNLYIELLTAQGRSEEALMLTRQKQLEDLDPSLRALQMQIWAEEELTAAREESESAINQAISDMEAQQSTLDSAADGFRNISDAIGDLIFDTYAALDSGSVSLSDAVEAARKGDFSIYENTNSTNEIGTASDYQNINDYIFARDVAFNKLAEIRELSLGAENVAENAIEAIDTNISQMTVDIFAQTESLEGINSSNANIDNGVLELVNTMKSEKESAEMAAIELKALLENLNRESVAANKTLKRIEQNTYEVIE